MNGDVVYHAARSIPRCPYLSPGRLRVELVQGSRSFKAFAWCGELEETGKGYEEGDKKAKDVLMDDIECLSNENNRVAVLELCEFWQDAPVGWYDTALEVAGWSRNSTNQNLAEDEGGIDIWSKGDRELRILGETRLSECGCGYDPLGGGISEHKSRLDV